MYTRDGTSLPDALSHVESPVEHLHHFGHTERIRHLDDTSTLAEASLLFNKPSIKQWVKDGIVYRYSTSRTVSPFELFVDLVLVGVVHQLADAAAEEQTGPAVLRFVLTFYVNWSIWSDHRNVVAYSGTDDFFHRMYTLLTSTLLVGVSINAAGIEVSNEALNLHVLENPPLKCTILFVIAAKVIRGLTHLYYISFLPEFRFQQSLALSHLLVVTAFYIGSLFAPDARKCATIVGVAGLFEMTSRIWTGLLGHVDRFLEERGKKTFPCVCLPVEHHAERNGAFLTLVLGEMVIGIMFNAGAFHAYGLSVMYEKAFYVLSTAFAINWIYFTKEHGLKKVHALRRHWLSSTIFTVTHWPLCASLILASAAVSRAVSQGQLETALRYYWGVGLAVTLVCISIIQLSDHREYPSANARKLYFADHAVRLGVAGACAGLSATEIDDEGWLAIYAGLFYFITINGIIGRTIVLKMASKASEFPLTNGPVTNLSQARSA